MAPRLRFASGFSLSSFSTTDLYLSLARALVARNSCIQKPVRVYVPANSECHRIGCSHLKHFARRSLAWRGAAATTSPIASLAFACDPNRLWCFRYSSRFSFPAPRLAIGTVLALIPRPVSEPRKTSRLHVIVRRFGALRLLSYAVITCFRHEVSTSCQFRWSKLHLLDWGCDLALRVPSPTATV